MNDTADGYSAELLLALDTWATSSDAMTTDQAQDWLAHHSIDTELIGGQVWAKEVITDKNGQATEEWALMTCTRSALRNWMNY